MRLLMINLLATAMLLVGAASASAFTLNLVPTTPTTVGIGDIISYDVFLDTEGASGITLFSVSLTFNPAVVQYRPDLSANNSYFPLYAPAATKGAVPTWLEPVPFNGNACTPGDRLCSNPPALWAGNQPAIGAQLNIDFIETNLGQTTATTDFITGTTVVQISTISFEAVGGGISNGEWSFNYGGNVFSLGGVDVSEDTNIVNAIGNATMVVPEPTTALLVGLGLVGLGVAGRRRA